MSAAAHVTRDGSVITKTSILLNISTVAGYEAKTELSKHMDKVTAICARTKYVTVSLMSHVKRVERNPIPM